MRQEVEQLADQKLKQCLRLMRIAGKRLSDLQSPVMSGMLRSSSYSNKAEDQIVNRLDAESELQEILRAISWLKTDERHLLIDRYFDVEEPNDIMVAYSMNLDERQYYRLKNKALREFAESYMNGSLFQNA